EEYTRPVNSKPSCGLAILAGIVFCSWPALAASSANFIIATKGQARVEIVVPESAASPIAFAAQELRRYVKEMSGAELPLVNTPSQKPAIALVVRTSLSPSDGARENDPREEDRYRLTIDAKTLRIEGASPRAVLFGAYDLLERLGCGWC